MKRLLLFSILSILCLAISAQTNTWTALNGDWNSIFNWSLGQIPTANHDVIIPTGSTVNLNTSAHTKSITVQGNAVFNMPAGGGYQLNFTNASSFSAASTLNWGFATMGGGGTITLSGTTNLVSGNHKFISDGTTIINEGIINHNDIGNIYILDGVLTNAASGVINFKTANGNISYSETGSHIFNNEGLISRTGSGRVDISAEFHNNGGTIAVESGTLYINGLKSYLTNGTYNVSPDATFRWNTEIECSGTLTGAPEGEIIISTASVTIPSGSTTYFNFTGNTGIIFDYVDAIKGSGTLVNSGKLTFRGASNKLIRENTSLRNEGIINYQATGTFYISDGTLINTASGSFDLQTEGGHIVGTGPGSHLFINEGVLKHTSGGSVNIGAELHNEGGTISVNSGTLVLNGDSEYLNGGIYNVSNGARFHWNTEVVCTGTLTGVLDGDIFCSTSSIKVPAAMTAIFDFTGTTGVVWNYLDITGSGILVNKGKLSLTSSSNKFIQENTTVRNEGSMSFEGSGTLYITEGELNNSGVIDLQTPYGNISSSGTSGVRKLSNSGLIKRTTDEGTVEINVATTNSGTIDVQKGILRFSGTQGFNNTVDGIVMGIGTLRLTRCR